MSKAQKIGLGLVLFHLVMVAIGAFQLDFPDKWGFMQYQLYGRVTGASSGYGFFAPGVGSQLRATFEILDKDSKHVATVPLEQGKNREADLRVGNIVGWFWKDTPQEGGSPNPNEMGSANPHRMGQRSMTASWAGKIFGRYPEAAAVVVKLEEFTMPSMEDYRKGVRAQWTQHYRAKFVKKDGA